MTSAMTARLLLFPTLSVTFPAAAVGVAVTFTMTGPGVAFTGPGVMDAVTIGGGVIVATVVGSTTGVVAVGTGVTSGSGIGEGVAVGEGVGHGTGVAPGEGVGGAVGAGVGVIVGLVVMLISVGTGRGVVIGPSGQPDGSRAMLCMVSWLMLAPTSTSAMGNMYRTLPTKHMMARKYNSALSIGLTLQDGQVPDQLLI
jgi:hypothetical protein